MPLIKMSELTEVSTISLIEQLWDVSCNYTDQFNSECVYKMNNSDSVKFHNNNTEGAVEYADGQFPPYPDLTQIPIIRMTLIIFYFIVMFLALFGNLIICYTVLSNRKMQTVVNCYIVNLAVCDILVGAFVLPVKLLELAAPADWITLNDGLCTTMLYLQTVIVFASVLTLVATCLERDGLNKVSTYLHPMDLTAKLYCAIALCCIAVKPIGSKYEDTLFRYFAIVHPLESRMHQSKSRTIRIIAAVWIIPCIAALPFLFPDVEAVINTLSSDYGTITRLTCFINFNPHFRRAYYTFLFVFFYLIPLKFIAWTCFCIAQALLKSTTLYRQGSLRRQEINRRKIGKMILIVVAAFTISWTPYFLVSIITQYQEVNFMQKHNFFFTMLCINLFAFINSSVNPFIYATMSSRFRSGFQRIFRFIFCYPNVSGGDADCDVNLLPRKKIPKPLTWINKYHRQMMLFVCGDPSQLSTDSSHQSESALQTGIAINSNSRVQKNILMRQRSYSTTISSSHHHSSSHYHSSLHHSSSHHRNSLNHFILSHSKSMNSCKFRTVNNHNERNVLNNLQQNQVKSPKKLNGVNRMSELSYSSLRGRTGSESLLPNLRKFWEENFIDIESVNIGNDNSNCIRSRTMSCVSASSLPNSVANNDERITVNGSNHTILSDGCGKFYSDKMDSVKREEPNKQSFRQICDTRV